MAVVNWINASKLAWSYAWHHGVHFFLTFLSFLTFSFHFYPSSRLFPRQSRFLVFAQPHNFEKRIYSLQIANYKTFSFQIRIDPPMLTLDISQTHAKLENVYPSFMNTTVYLYMRGFHMFLNANFLQITVNFKAAIELHVFTWSKQNCIGRVMSKKRTNVLVV